MLQALAPLSALFIAPACHSCGCLANRLGLPSITGFLVAGVLAGPHVLGLVSEETIHHLWMIDHVCLSFIALAAGAELLWENVERAQKQVWMITLGISGVTWLVLFFSMAAMSGHMAFTSAMNAPQLYIVCSLCATLMIARSPASAIAVLHESGGKGPFCTLVLTVIILKDVFAIVAFSVNIEFGKAFFTSGTVHLHPWALVKPLVSVLVAVGLGVSASEAIRTVTSAINTPSKAPRLFKEGALVLCAALTFQSAVLLEAEPLLACAIAGLIATNRMAETSRENFLSAVQSVLPHVNLAFFSLSGASLRIEDFHKTLLLAAMLFFARLLAVIAGSFLGCLVSAAPPSYRRCMWQTMLTQAGVALGLTRMVGVQFPQWGREFQALMAAVIVCNLCIGPPLFRAAIFAMREGRSDRKSAYNSPVATSSTCGGPQFSNSLDTVDL